MVIVSNELGNPGFVLTGGTAADRSSDAGSRSIHLSMSHDAGIAIAQVVAERADA